MIGCSRGAIRPAGNMRLHAKQNFKNYANYANLANFDHLLKTRPIINTRNSSFLCTFYTFFLTILCKSSISCLKSQIIKVENDRK